MVNVVAVCTCGCHDGGIGDGGAVVTAYSACETSGNTNEYKLVAFGEYCENDRNENTEGTPGCTGGECENASDKEDNRGKERGKRCREAFHGGFYEGREAEKTGYILKRCRKGKNEDRGNHGDKALGKSLHSVFEGNETAKNEVSDDENECDKRAPRQTNGCVCVSESGYEVCTVKEAAAVKKTCDAGDNEHNNGDEKVENVNLFDINGSFFCVCSIESGVVTVFSFDSEFTHFAVVKAEKCDGDNENECHKRIEVEGDRADEELDTGIGFGFNVAGNSCCPRGNGRDHTNGSRGRVNDVRKLYAGNLMSVGYGAHNSANGKAVEIVVDEDENAKKECCECCADLGFDVGFCPTAECGGCACLINEGNDNTEDNEEEEDACGAFDGSDKAFADQGIHCAGEAEVGCHERADKNADEKGRISFLGDECKSDCDHGRQNCPKRVCERKAFAAGCVYDGEHYDDNKRDRKSNQTFLLTKICHENLFLHSVRMINFFQ